jgi:hypothetical protein
LGSTFYRGTKPTNGAGSSFDTIHIENNQHKKSPVHVARQLRLDNLNNTRHALIAAIQDLKTLYEESLKAQIVHLGAFPKVCHIESNNEAPIATRSTRESANFITVGRG